MCHYNNPGPGLLVCAIATILDLQHGSNVKNVTEEGRRGGEGRGGKGREGDQARFFTWMTVVICGVLRVSSSDTSVLLYWNISG